MQYVGMYPVKYNNIRNKKIMRFIGPKTLMKVFGGLSPQNQ